MAECWSPISICGAQINRLDCDGNVLNGTTDVVLSCGVVELERSDIVGSERSATDPNGIGGYCAKRVINPTVEGYEYSITWCSRIDPELLEVLGLFERVVEGPAGTQAANTIGFRPKAASASCLCDGGAACENPGVSMLIWKLAWDGENPHPRFDFDVEAIPKLVARPGTTFTYNDEFNQIVVTGRTTANMRWGNGPGGIYPLQPATPGPQGLVVDFASFLSNTAWPGGCNCSACGYSAAGVGVV